jgi:hypothetical protein
MLRVDAVGALAAFGLEGFESPHIALQVRELKRRYPCLALRNKGALRLQRLVRLMTRRHRN